MTPDRPSASLPPSAVRLRELMDANGVSVNALSKAVANGNRKAVQRWLAGTTITLPNRRKLAMFFRVSPDDFAPPDVLADLRPLLEQVEAMRRLRGLRVGTVVHEVRRLAELS